VFEKSFQSFENRNQMLNDTANGAKGQKRAAMVAARVFAVADPRISRLFYCKPRSAFAGDCQPGGHCGRMLTTVRKVGPGKSNRSARRMSREKALVLFSP